MPVFAARYIVSGSGVVDTSDAAAMRTALGLGSAAVAASTAFALASHTQGPSTIAGATTTGQVLLSLTDGTFTAARLTAGSNVTLTHGSGSLVIDAAGGGATSARLMFPATALDSLGTNGASLLNLGNATTARLCRGFDDTTETYAYGSFQVPSNINTAGTVLFNAIGGLRSSTTGNVLWTFGEREAATGEAWTGSYTEYDSAATSFAGATTTQLIVGWSTSASALGWQSGDMVRFRVSRDPAASGDATGDALLDYFYIDIPTS